MAAHSEQQQEEQALRRAFDTAYSFDPLVIVRGLLGMSRRARWLLLASFASLVLVVILVQLFGVAMDVVEEMNRPPLLQRLDSPYGLETRAAPSVVEGRDVLPGLVGHITYDLEPTVFSPVLECMVEPMSEACMQPDVDPLPAVQHIEAVGFVSEANFTRLQEAAFEAELEARLAEAQAAAEALAAEEAAAAEAVAAEEAQAGAESEESAELAASEPVDSELAAADTDEQAADAAAGGATDDGSAAMREALAAELTAEIEEEGLELDLNAGTADVRIMAVNYLTEGDAYDAIYTLFDHSRRIGRIGNYVLVDTQPVNYYYAYSRGRAAFVWSHGTWVFWVSADTLASVEDVVKGFPY